ncbi:alpha/beta hydrolase family protein [Nocardioides sp. LHG3406-4]|uniref:alpha/beta hydrolase family protein n=1 Tax=Nocardioides sp. LHG3406-4 TaxID=2804575 RepID=UPI003CF041F5
MAAATATAARWAGALSTVVVLLTTACSASDQPDGEGAAPEPSATPSPMTSESPAPAPTTSAAPTPRPAPPALPAYFDRGFSGGGLRLGAVRERMPDYTSYDVTYRSEDLRISGVLNVPTGRGPFPAVVLAHGYIDPAFYVRGQGMTRERGTLARAGYVALHVDYRNHAESGDDPSAMRNFRTAYAVDVINAVHALRRSDDVPVDDDKVAVMGRSMGGGVVYKVLEMAPGLVGAGIAYSPVSTLEADNFNQFNRDGDRQELVRYVDRRWGLPEERSRENDELWESVSARTYLDRITEPVLIVQGRNDDTCPPAWARATQRAMVAAGVDSRLELYDDGHAFGPQYTASMERIVAFLDRRLG